MAGLGRKEFDSGEFLTAADVNGYLMDQSVMRFADSTARSSAIGTPTEGMVSYLDTQDYLEVFDGSAWVRVGQEGDITAVTAGTALTGGGTSGSVTLDVDETELFTGHTAGGAAYSAGTAGLAFTQAGTAGQILSSTGTAVEWVDQPPAGIEVSATPPSSPAEGDTWWDSDNGKTYIYYDGYWVQLQLAEAGSDGALSPNYIINGAFDIWQRGTSFPSVGNFVYTADRWQTVANTDIEQSTDVPNDNFEYSIKMTGRVGTLNRIETRIESVDAKSLVSKDCIISFWMKANQALIDNNDSVVNIRYANSKDDFTTSTNIQPSNNIISQLTVDTWSFVEVQVSNLPIEVANGIELRILSNVATTPASAPIAYITGVQLEAGSIATPFKRNANSIQGELAACQRYYYVIADGGGKQIALANYYNSGFLMANFVFPTTMRSAPTLEVNSGTDFYVTQQSPSGDTLNTLTSAFASTNSIQLRNNTEASGTQGSAYQLITNAAGARVAVSAEL